MNRMPSSQPTWLARLEHATPATWFVLAAAAVVLLAALWTVCQGQVQRAHARHAQQSDVASQDCDPRFALPAMGHCAAAVVTSER